MARASREPTDACRLAVARDVLTWLAARSSLSGGGSGPGNAQPTHHRQGIEALGTSGYTALQIATSLGEHHVKLVPDIAVGGAGGGGMLEALTARLLAGGLQPTGKS